MINTLIIEDEQPAADRLARLLKHLSPDIEITGIADTVVSAVKWLESHPQPDLIMLDIQLGDGLSFEIFNKTKVESYVIFTTAYDEYAIRAFEINSIDYLLKPVVETRLAKSLDKFRKLHSMRQNPDIEKLMQMIGNRESRFKKRFSVAFADKIKVVETEDIAFFYSRDKTSFLCTMDKRHFPVEFSLDHLESVLNPEHFFRVNRQFIVHYRSISKISVLSRSRIKIDTTPSPDDEILVSSARTAEFRQWLDK